MTQTVQGEVRILPNAAAIARRTADQFIKAANAAVAGRGVFTVALAGGSREFARCSKIFPRTDGVPPAKIRGLPNFADAIGQRSAGFARKKEKQLVARGFDELSGAVEHRGAGGAAGFVPAAPTPR